MNLYEIENLKFSYQLDSQRVEALRGISFQIKPGSFVCLSGPSGSGKSTLLNILGLIEPAQQGGVRFSSRELKTLTESERNRIRRTEIGFVFQSFQLFPVLDAYENVEFFLTRQRLPSKERSRRVREALESVGLWEHRNKRPLAMSGGQRQRVAVARAIAKNPKVIIADEPTASLDQKTGREIMEIFGALNRNRGVTVLASSHDPMVESFATQRLHLMDGKLL